MPPNGSPRIVYSGVTATVEEMQRGKESRFWQQIAYFLEQRRDSLLQQYYTAADVTAIKEIQREQRVLTELLDLPDVIISSLNASAAVAQKEPDNAE